MPLIRPDALLRRLDDERVVVIDCRFNLADPGAGRSEWRAAHIPGARYAHLDDDLAGPVQARGGRHPLPDPGAFGQRLADWGVSEEQLVVAYDNAGGAIAGRLWWLMRSYGHREVRVLDGGFAAWLAGQLPIEHSTPAPNAVTQRALVPGQMPTVDAAGVEEGLRDGSRVLIDVRDAARFAGQTEPLDKVAGHVPGAVNLPLGDNVDAAGYFLGPRDMRKRFERVLNGRPARDAIVMCGSGVSACQTLVALEHAGLDGAALYAGSWSDWISDPSRPVATF
jgi:thiosulfate/3-mercaptopyruvate sulfurtransferase